MWWRKKVIVNPAGLLPPPQGKAHTLCSKPLSKALRDLCKALRKSGVHVHVNESACSQTSRLDCKFPTLCQRLEFMCTLTWSLFPFPVQLTWLLFRGANAHWVTHGQRSNTWKKSQQTNTQGEYKTYLAGGAFRNNIFLYNYETIDNFWMDGRIFNIFFFKQLRIEPVLQ